MIYYYNVLCYYYNIILKASRRTTALIGFVGWTAKKQKINGSSSAAVAIFTPTRRHRPCVEQDFNVGRYYIGTLPIYIGHRQIR